MILLQLFMARLPVNQVEQFLFNYRIIFTRLNIFRKLGADFCSESYFIGFSKKLVNFTNFDENLKIFFYNNKFDRNFFAQLS